MKGQIHPIRMKIYVRLTGKRMYTCEIKKKVIER